ncbi:dsRBD fold-containing protein [Actinacidiphila sp. DG2A-62]|jgi:hypothetical protein|uniref:dsRBD fold-containing protein n=1 Tax=Actinacidiphila sp. DG2A-62 TaxID=3108821 RepID=UPI002DB93004|nr:dsRBD fold-containing protein [Actinacidiphila sp. DG2A-62]MEC3998452.1 dsRBD fold-containing protein [Actinacidiphila sp. DG2A-62]
MQQRTAPQARTKTWTLRMDIVEENDDDTTVEAVLDTGGRTLRCRSTAQRSRHDPPAPEVGDEYAAGRALLDLGRQLLGRASADAEQNERSMDRAWPLG